MSVSHGVLLLKQGERMKLNKEIKEELIKIGSDVIPPRDYKKLFNIDPPTIYRACDKHALLRYSEAKKERKAIWREEQQAYEQELYESRLKKALSFLQK